MNVVICTRDLTKVLKASLYLPNTLVKINSGNFKPRNGRGPRNRIPNSNCKMATFDFDSSDVMRCLQNENYFYFF